MPGTVFIMYNTESHKLFYAATEQAIGDTEYTKTSTLNKQVREALDKALESADVLQSSGSLNIFSLRLKIIDLKKQYPIEGE